MKQVPVVDVSGYGPYNHGAGAPLFWGFLGMILIETMVFASFVSSYFYLRAQAVDWPPAGTHPPGLLLPTLNTLVLVASSGAVWMAERAAKRGDKRPLQWWLTAAALMAVTFLVLKAVEYSDKDYHWDTHAYGSIVWTIVGFHSAHVIALLLKTVVVNALAFRGFFNRERRLGVQVNGIYWHFVVAIWIPLYVVLYWVPRL